MPFVVDHRTPSFVAALGGAAEASSTAARGVRAQREAALSEQLAFARIDQVRQQMQLEKQRGAHEADLSALQRKFDEFKFQSERDLQPGRLESQRLGNEQVGLEVAGDKQKQEFATTEEARADELHRERLNRLRQDFQITDDAYQQGLAARTAEERAEATDLVIVQAQLEDFGRRHGQTIMRQAGSSIAGMSAYGAWMAKIGNEKSLLVRLTPEQRRMEVARFVKSIDDALVARQATKVRGRLVDALRFNRFALDPQGITGDERMHQNDPGVVTQLESLALQLENPNLSFEDVAQVDAAYDSIAGTIETERSEIRKWRAEYEAGAQQVEIVRATPGVTQAELESVESVLSQFELGTIEAGSLVSSMKAVIASPREKLAEQFMSLVEKNDGDAKAALEAMRTAANIAGTPLPPELVGDPTDDPEAVAKAPLLFETSSPRTRAYDSWTKSSEYFAEMEFASRASVPGPNRFTNPDVRRTALVEAAGASPAVVKGKGNREEAMARALTQALEQNGIDLDSLTPEDLDAFRAEFERTHAKDYLVNDPRFRIK